jgi:hypothetical protein
LIRDPKLADAGLCGGEWKGGSVIAAAWQEVIELDGADNPCLGICGRLPAPDAL